MTLNGFQKQVNLTPAPGSEGQRASMNPVSTVVAGPGALVADEGGVRVGSFAWVVSGVAGYGTDAAGTVRSTGAPDGFIGNEQQGLITIWLGESTLVVPEGLPVTLFDRGDFWARSFYNEAAIGNKVYANIYTGQILAAATGAFPVDVAGSATTVTASFATNVMTVTVTDGYIAPGMKVTKAGVPANTYIMAQLSGSAGSTGTYSLTTYPGTIGSAAGVLITAPEGVGGATVSSASADSGSATMTINTVTNGSIAVGQKVSATSVPTGTYVSAIGTFNGTSGTITLSAITTDTITTAAVLFSPWVETAFYVKSVGNVSDLIKIGVRN